MVLLAYLSGSVLPLGQKSQNHRKNSVISALEFPYSDLQGNILSLLIDAMSLLKFGLALENGPPPHWAKARMARYIVHNSDWAVFASLSSREPFKGFPFASATSISDGYDLASSSGIPYIYKMSGELSVNDWKLDSRAAMTATLAQGDYCSMKHMDPQDPRCARVTLTGSIIKVKANSTEETFAKEALFTRHPSMEDWPKDHHFFIAKLKVENVLILDFFGGASQVNIEDYFSAKPY